MTHPLANVLVLDLTQRLAGPYATMILGDLGARIIKVEPPGGDETREFIPRIGDESTYFLSVNRNKESIVLNLKDPRGLAVFHQLAALADVVIDNYRPGVLERLGIDYTTLKELNPRLISCSITGFGSSGPYRDRPAYDMIVQALGGGMSLTGLPEGPPLQMGFAVGDLTAGLLAVQGVLAALLARHQTGRGQRVDIALLDGQIALQAYHASAWLLVGEAPRRMWVVPTLT